MNIKGVCVLFNNFIQNGVVIKPNVLAHGDNATLLYKGLLQKSGAQSVVMHYGYGNDWSNSGDIKMHKTADGFEANFTVTSDDQLNIAFKDCANNWDNNSGQDYSFEVQNKNVTINDR